MKKNAVSILFVSLICVLFACNTPSANETKNIKNKNSETTTQNANHKNGQAVYKSYCLTCHGKNGDAKLAGAKDLTASKLSEAETRKIIEEGSKNKKMLAYGKLLKASDVEAVTAYVMSLQK